MRALIGCGSSYHAALLAAHFDSNARAWVASEYPGGHSEVIAISQSGETGDVLKAVRRGLEEGSRIHAVTNTPGSSITRFASEVTLIACGPERAVAATKSFMSTLRALGVPLSKITKTQIEDLVVPAVPQARSVLFLGAGKWYPLALEGALKMLECANIPALGIVAAEIKHGAIALIEQGTPVVILGDCAAAECSARGARILRPPADMALAIVWLQLFAYKTTVARGLDPDYPRNLAKSVTVS